MTPDQELIALVSSFKDSQACLDTGDKDGMAEDERAEEIARWYNVIERATELKPATREGRVARATIAYGALASTEADGLQREEKLALVSLGELLGELA